MGATDTKFRIFIEGVEQDAIAKIENVIKGLNTATQATKQFSRERQQLARAERQDRFRSLSEEEQYQRLLRRREQIENRLAKARANGAMARVNALELSLARNRSAVSASGQRLIELTAARSRAAERAAVVAERARLDAIKKSPPPVISGSLPPVLQAVAPGLLSRIGGAFTGQLAGRAGGGLLGGILGAAGGPLGIAAGIGGGLILGDLAKRLAEALADSVKATIRFADEISDLADQMGLSNREVLALRNASGTAGVKSGKAFQGLAALAAARSAALGGDERSLALFQRYGISPEMLNSGASDLQLASNIFGSLGSGGATAADAGPLRALFGKRPEQMMAVLRAYASLAGSAATDTEEALGQLGAISDKLEQVQFAWQIFKGKVAGSVIQFWKDNASLMGTVAGAAAKYLGPLIGSIPGLSSIYLGPLIGLSSIASALLPKAAAAASEAGLFGGPGPNPVPKERKADPNAFDFSASQSLPEGVKLGPFAAADALARIGLFRGPIDPDRADVFRQQLAELRKIRVSQEKTSRDLQQNLT